MRLAYAVDQQLAGWTVTLRRGDESPLPAGAAFTLPGGGNRIQASNPAGPGHVRLTSLTHPDRTLELHGSLRWRGRSGALHECDVSAVPAWIAHQLRTHGGGYPRGLPVAAIECKDKGGVGTLDETRQTVARMFDLCLVTQPGIGLPPCRIYEDRTGSTWGAYRSTYRSFFSWGAFGVVRQAGFQSGCLQLAAHYSVRLHPTIYATPAHGLGLQARFLATLRAIAAM